MKIALGILPGVITKLDRKFAAFLRARRGKATLEIFARKLGVGVSTLHSWENLQRSITVRQLDQIKRRLRCGLGEIFPGE